jgi:hypothetical protein
MLQYGNNSGFRSPDAAAWSVNPYALQFQRPPSSNTSWFFRRMGGNTGNTPADPQSVSFRPPPFSYEGLSSTFTASAATMSATITKQTEKVNTASMTTMNATIAKQTSRSLTASMATFSGAIGKFMTLAETVFSASMATMSATNVKQTSRSLAASMATMAGAIVKMAQKIFNAS